MMTYLEAKNRGRSKCSDLLGYDFCLRNKDNSLASYSMNEEDEEVRFFIGIDDNPPSVDNHKIVLDHSEFSFFAHVAVNRTTGEIVVLNKRLPVKSDN